MEISNQISDWPFSQLSQKISDRNIAYDTLYVFRLKYSIFTKIVQITQNSFKR